MTHNLRMYNSTVADRIAGWSRAESVAGKAPLAGDMVLDYEQRE
jgi:hypothetical protein